MSRTKRIDNILKKHLNNFSIKIVDNSQLHKGHNSFNGENETHIQIYLINLKKTSVNRLEIHKKINSLLENEFNNGLHSLEIKITL